LGVIGLHKDDGMGRCVLSSVADDVVENGAGELSDRGRRLIRVNVGVFEAGTSRLGDAGSSSYELHSAHSSKSERLTLKVDDLDGVNL
jgi:hypothetical protein